jgi:hypothetical protein|tara:strand:- start:164 stop:586 length:423 start_codon:yes stop_codon:yes gene_type:complete
MSEINDFGFTAVDQDELKTKTGEDASIGKEVAEKLEAVAKSSAGQANSAQIDELDSKLDLLTKLVGKSLNELDDHKDNLTQIDSNKELDYKDRLIECEKLILPLLQNLMKNEDKEYIYWPNRKAIIQSQIDRLQKITQKT